MGYVEIHFNTSPEELVLLTQENAVENEKNNYNSDGEFRTPVGQLPLSRLLVIPLKALRGGHKDKDLINSLYSLQHPDSSPWGKPFIRLVSSHTYDKATETVKLNLFVYFTRLIFELIADPSIKLVVENLQGIPANIIPIQKKKKQATIFKSSNNELSRIVTSSFLFQVCIVFLEN